MSDLGDIGGEALGMFIGIPLGIVCLIATPFMMIDSCHKEYKEKKSKIEHVAKVYDTVTNPKEAIKHPILTYKSLKVEQEPSINTPKESLSFRAGQAVKESTKDFARGIFTKKQSETQP